jgi:hypothetical protein
MARKLVGLVHYYDTQRHLILCEAGGFELHSTKHPRRVTCSACIELLATEASSRRQAATDTASHTVA